MDKYRKIVVLGKGGNGVVYLCQHKTTLKEYALKEIPLENSSFQIEKNLLRTDLNVQHGLLHCIETFQDDGFNYLVLTYIRGDPLYRLIWNRSNPWPERTIQQLTAECIDTLTYLHSTTGFIHGDFKSGNVLIDRSNGHLWLIDFGSAREIGSKKTKSPTQYIDPPLKNETISTSIDWFGLGVLVYELIYGQPPWSYHSSPDLSLFPSDSSSSLALDFIKQCLFQEIQSPKDHEWLQSINWNNLREKDLSFDDGDESDTSIDQSLFQDF